MAYGSSCLVVELWGAFPVSSHFIWEMERRGHVEHIWQRRSHGTWCAWIRAIDDDWWARGESDFLKSHEEACVEWAARLVESRVGT
jgi:hypothetical protein